MSLPLLSKSFAFANLQLPEIEEGANSCPLINNWPWDKPDEPRDSRERKAGCVPQLKLAVWLLVVDLINAGFHCTVNPNHHHQTKKTKNLIAYFQQMSL